MRRQEGKKARRQEGKKVRRQEGKKVRRQEGEKAEGEEGEKAEGEKVRRQKVKKVSSSLNITHKNVNIKSLLYSLCLHQLQANFTATRFTKS